MVYRSRSYSQWVVGCLETRWAGVGLMNITSSIEFERWLSLRIRRMRRRPRMEWIRMMKLSHSMKHQLKWWISNQLFDSKTDSEASRRPNRTNQSLQFAGLSMIMISYGSSYSEHKKIQLSFCEIKIIIKYYAVRTQTTSGSCSRMTEAGAEKQKRRKFLSIKNHWFHSQPSGAF